MNGGKCERGAMVRTRAGPLLVALLVAAFLCDSSAQVVTTTLPALLGAVGTLSLQPATYSFSSTESANITSSLVVAGQGNVEGAATASTLDLSTYPALANSTAQRPIIIQPGVTLSLVNLTLRLPPLPASLAAAPVSLLQHVVGVAGSGARLTLERVTLVAANCSELQAFARVLCRPTGTNLRFYPSNVMAIVNGVVQYGNGTMQLAATDGSSAAASAAAVAGASLVSSAATCAAAPVPPATAPAGPAAPYVCSATSVGNAVQLRTAAAALLNNTAEVVAISVTGNVSINASVWRGALALPHGLVLSLLGNPTAGQGVQIDFGGVAPAFTASSYGSSGAVRLRDLNLVGLPYSRTVNSPMDFFSPWLHPFRVFRGGSGGATSTPQLIATSCVLWLPDQEASWWNTALLAASSVNALEARPWLARLFTLPVTASSSSSSTSGGVRGTRVTSLNDAGGVARFTDCTFASLYDSPANAPRSEFATIAWWPLMEGVPAAVSYQAALGEYAVINSSLAAASIGAQSSWASSIFLATANTSAGTSAIFASAEPAPRHNPAAGDFGPQYPLAGRAVRGPPGNQTGQVAFWDLQGVTGELYGSTSATLQDLVLYNLAPGGALPYGGGFAVPGSDLYRKLLLYGSSNWNATVNETTGQPNPLPALGSVAFEDTLANLTLPLWYFARPANSDNGLMSLYRVVLVVPAAELQLWLYLLAQAKKLPASYGPPSNATTSTSALQRRLLLGRGTSDGGGSSRRALQQTSGSSSSSSSSNSSVVVPGKAAETLRAAALAATVSWYTNDTIALSYLWLPRNWVAYDLVLTAVLPPGAPTPLLSYEPTYDPASYPPPSPPSPPPPPSPAPPLAPSPPPATPTPPRSTPAPPTSLPSSPSPSPLRPVPSPPGLSNNTGNPGGPGASSALEGSANPSPPPAAAESAGGGGGGSSAVGIAVGVSVGVVAASALVILGVLFYRRRQQRAAEATAAARKAAGGPVGGSIELAPWGGSSSDESGLANGHGANGSGNGNGIGRSVAVGAATAKGNGNGVTAAVGASPAATPRGAAAAAAAAAAAVASSVQEQQEQAFERLHQQAAAAPTAADTMALLAAAAANASAAASFLAGGGGAGGSGAPPPAAAAFAAVSSIQLVIVDDGAQDRIPVGARPVAVGAVGTPPPATGGTGADSGALVRPAGGSPAPAAGGAAAAVAAMGKPLSRLGDKSLLQTVDIESALLAYSSRSMVNDREPAAAAATQQQARGSLMPAAGSPPQPPSPAGGVAAPAGAPTPGGEVSSAEAPLQPLAPAAPPRAGADLAAAISSLQAELSGRQEQLRITTVLGKGSFGVVYLGTWRGLRVAVKTLVVHDALLGTEGRRRQRAILEAAISTSLHHPNVVATYAFEVKPLGVVASSQQMMLAQGSDAGGSTSGGAGGAGAGGAAGERSVWESAGDVYKLYIIQEYCDVGTLRDALTNGVVGSVSAGGAAALCALTLALDVACGMFHIHSKNIVHGDLSSANILLTTIKVAPLPGALGALAGGGPGGGGGQPNVFGNLADTMAAGRSAGARSLAAAVSRLRGLWRPPVIAKVADFGLSVRMGEGQTHASNKFQGTPLYSAPEVLTRGRLTKAADVFSYGVMLLEFFYGSYIAEITANCAVAAAPGADSTEPGGGSTAAGEGSSAAGGGGAETIAPIAGGRFGVAVPASCPPHLRNLMVACIAPEAAARPTFEQVVDSLVDMLLTEHQEELSAQQQQQRQRQRQQPQRPSPSGHHNHHQPPWLPGPPAGGLDGGAGAGAAAGVAGGGGGLGAGAGGGGLLANGLMSDDDLGGIVIRRLPAPGSDQPQPLAEQGGYGRLESSGGGGGLGAGLPFQPLILPGDAGNGGGGGGRGGGGDGGIPGLRVVRL